MILNISHMYTSSNGNTYRIMNKSHYPENWKSITYKLKKDNNFKCQHCGIKDKTWGYRKDNGEFVKVDSKFIEDLGIKTSPVHIKSQYLTLKLVKIHLQAAHKIHNKDHSQDNLLCLCERCHGLYDANYHTRVKNYRLRKIAEENGQLRLF